MSRQKYLFAERHGDAKRGARTRTYKIWMGMVARCHVASATGFPEYGAKGIQVCERWRRYENFLADMGEAPAGLSIDRQESTGNYEPGNCRWADRQTQNENRRSVRWVEFDGSRLTATGWARKLGISKAALYDRLKHWSLPQALGAEPPPVQVRKPASDATREKLRVAAQAREQRKRDQRCGA